MDSWEPPPSPCVPSLSVSVKKGALLVEKEYLREKEACIERIKWCSIWGVCCIALNIFSHLSVTSLLKFTTYFNAFHTIVSFRLIYVTNSSCIVQPTASFIFTIIVSYTSYVIYTLLWSAYFNSSYYWKWNPTAKQWDISELLPILLPWVVWVGCGQVSLQ